MGSGTASPSDRSVDLAQGSHLMFGHTHVPHRRARNTPDIGGARPRFALLHATWHRHESPLQVRSEWLSQADQPDAVEYIFAMDADDERSVRHTAGAQRVISPEAPGEVTSVRNWNAAASASSAGVLVVVADDLFPTPGWDTRLCEAIGPLDPRRQSFAVKVADDPADNDQLMRHPVVSRAFYERLGLFAPEFRGVYCDNEITLRAYWKSLIIDGRAVVFDHRHAPLEETEFLSSSQSIVNAKDEYPFGAAVYESLWSRHRRRVSVRTIPADAVRTGSELEWRRLRARQLALAHLESGLKAARTAVCLGVHPSRLIARATSR
jgi:hypothetical protein